MSVPEIYSEIPESSPRQEETPPEPAAGPVAVPPLVEDTQIRRRHRLRRPLPLWLRIVVLLVGWIVVLVGIAGLVLPGIQGIATIVIGAAILSVASEIAYELMRKAFRRWPAIWDRVERFRDRIQDKLHDFVHRG
ncbi:MAG TPA: PGPGW domain-containing protein [Thermoanaerobaculia bacterium]|nr:PGPGW domain-containing protein [Thermoanaerobaculia bacterium]